MANLSITLECNRDCGYCFATSDSAAGQMSVECFERTLDFLERSGIDQARLLGGEPTLHPQFPLFVDRVLKRGLRLLVFTNGIVPESALRCLEETPIDRAAVLLNITPTSGHHPEVDDRQSETMRRLGLRVALGLNFYTPAIDPRFLLDLVREYGLSPNLRLGLAHPRVAGSNAYLRPREYKTVGQRLVEFACEARAAGVGLTFDCGFVPCMFPQGSLEMLGNDGAELGRRCSPILDVLPNGDVVSCYPLASLHRERLSSYDAVSLRQVFHNWFSNPRLLGVFPECARCALRQEGGCAGGCLAASMRQLRGGDFAVAVPRPASASSSGVPAAGSGRLRVDAAPSAGNPILKESGARRWVIPYVDQPLSFWEQIQAELGPHIREVYFPLPADLVGSGEPPQPDGHLLEFLSSGLLASSVLVNPITLPQPVECIAPRVIEALRRLAGQFGIGSATVSNLLLAARIREKLPDLPLTASVLMDITHPNQTLMLRGLCECFVPSSRVMRDLSTLENLRSAFHGRIRIIVNEACLPGCPYRVQHFHEMCTGVAFPLSLCQELLEREPWMRMTGAWVLPQHLHFYDGLYDELKLGGRVTLKHAATYLRVLHAYVHRLPLDPHEIGGGPASVLHPMEIQEGYYARTLRCGLRCHECGLCRDYYDRAVGKRQESRLVFVSSNDYPLGDGLASNEALSPAIPVSHRRGETS